MLLWLILSQILVTHINISKSSITVSRRLTENEDSLSFFRSDTLHDCPNSFCGENASCVSRRCCNCLCKKGYYFFSFKHGCINSRTWKDASVSFGDKNELVPMVISPTDLQHKKIIVPGIQLKSKCMISLIYYYDSYSGEEHSLIKNPSLKYVSVRNAINGFIVISVSIF